MTIALAFVFWACFVARVIVALVTKDMSLGTWLTLAMFALLGFAVYGNWLHALGLR